MVSVTDGNGLAQDSSHILKQVLDTGEIRMSRDPGSPLTPALTVGSWPKHPFGHFYGNRSARKSKKLTDTCNNMDAAQKHHAGQMKPDIKTYILYKNPIFVKFYNRQN